MKQAISRYLPAVTRTQGIEKKIVTELPSGMITLTYDVEEILRLYSERARRSKGGKATMLNGTVKITFKKSERQ